MALYPGDIDSRRVDSKALAIVHYNMNPEEWDFKEQTGHDFGTDCTFELIEEREWRGRTIEVQIKGTRDISKYLINNGSTISFQLKKAVIRRALNRPCPFFLFIVDVETEAIFFQELHRYFLSDAIRFDQLDAETDSMVIHVSVNSLLKQNEGTMLELAKETYAGGPSRHLRIVSEEREEA